MPGRNREPNLRPSSDRSTEASADLLSNLLRLLIPSGKSFPRVIHAPDTLTEVVNVLPSTWARIAVEPVDFSIAIERELLHGPVVAIPLWSPRDRSRDRVFRRDALWEVTECLQGLTDPLTGHKLLLIVPFQFLVSGGSIQRVRAELMQKWDLQVLVTVAGQLPRVHSAVRWAVLVLGSKTADGPVVRMFEVPGETSVPQESALADFERLLKLAGGTTDFGYVLREPLPPGAPLIFRNYHPDVVRRRGELAEYGRVARLDEVFEVIANVPQFERRVREAQNLQPETTSRDAPGARRVISGRQVLRDHSIAEADEDSQWFSGEAPVLRQGDIIVRSLLSPRSAINRGLVWARVSLTDLPAVAGANVIVLRPRSEMNDFEIDFVLRYLSSHDVFDLSEDHRLSGMTSFLPSSALRELTVPVPDEPLAEALKAVEEARNRSGEWSVEADEILDSLFDGGGGAISRQTVMERSRIVRLRMKAVDDVETLSGQVRTQYPLPIAYKWRLLEAARSTGATREAYQSALDAGEQTLALVANIGLAFARATGCSVSVVDDIATRLSRRQGPTISDWCNILDELAGRSFSGIDDLISSTEFRDFCLDKEISESRWALVKRRNDEFHHRRVEEHRLAEEYDDTLLHLEKILGGLAFLLDTPLIIAREVRWDTIQNTGVLSYQRLSGDHPVVPLRQMTVRTALIELGSLYLMDSTQELHLLRPYLAGRNCDQCGTFSVFHIDRYIAGELTFKSMEHGHTVDASPALIEATKAVGLIQQAEFDRRNT